MRDRPVTRIQRAACGGAVAALALVAYFRTLLPGVGFWDIGEFQTVPHVLGIAHPTGYPLYTLIGKLATLWPFGTIAGRMNGLSALTAAGAAGLLTGVILQLRVRPWLAVAAGLAFAFSGHVWRTATHADPHTLHAALVAGLWVLALRWRETREARWLFAVALVAGLGLGNHMLLAFELPALALVVLWPHRSSLGPRVAAGALAWGLAGLAVYAYLPLRARMAPPLNYADPTTWERFRYLVLGEQFQGGMAFLSLEGLKVFWDRLPQLFAWHGQWLSGPGVVLVMGLAAMGALALWRRGRVLAVALFLGGALPFYLAGTYVNADLGRYFIVPTLLGLVLAALGAQYLGERLGGRAQDVLGVLLVLLALGLVPRNLPLVDVRHQTEADRYQRAVFASVKPRAVILSWWSYSTPLWYGRFVEERRPDVTIVDESEMVHHGWGDMARTAARFRDRPVYVIPPPEQLPELRRVYRLIPVTLPEDFGQDVYELTGKAEPTSP